jgi:DNA (cytosine-5)-methyltransferase 1
MSVKVFDFFSGCGGTSCGFSAAGMDIVLGLDVDEDSANTFRTNFPLAGFLNDDIRTMDVDVLEPYIVDRAEPILFCGCAPCQPFSKQNRQKTKTDPRRNLLAEFGRFVAHWMPEYVFIENVPGMQKVKSKTGPFKRFTSLLSQLGYQYTYEVLPARWFGVPQKRDRLVLLATLNGCVSLPTPTHGPERLPYATVRDWIFGLPPLAAGAVDQDDPDHVAAKLSELNLRRIAHTPEGGSRDQWPDELWLDCHREHTGHTDVYGRLSWDRPAAGLTTKCISFSNGRFGHPEQDRALSVREAARLQTFPLGYRFTGTLQSKARQIGNAVPPLMAEVIGRQLVAHANGG